MSQEDDLMAELSSVEPKPLIAQSNTIMKLMQSSIRAKTEALREKGEIHDPSALDVIKQIINPDKDQKASEHMKGHVSQEVINETFLMDAKQKFPESTLRINC